MIRRMKDAERTDAGARTNACRLLTHVHELGHDYLDGLDLSLLTQQSRQNALFYLILPSQLSVSEFKHLPTDGLSQAASVIGQKSHIRNEATIPENTADTQSQFKFSKQ